jgi:hypothetical protein
VRLSIMLVRRTAGGHQGRPRRGRNESAPGRARDAQGAAHSAIAGTPAWTEPMTMLPTNRCQLCGRPLSNPMHTPSRAYQSHTCFGLGGLPSGRLGRVAGTGGVSGNPSSHPNPSHPSLRVPARAAGLVVGSRAPGIPYFSDFSRPVPCRPELSPLPERLVESLLGLIRAQLAGSVDQTFRLTRISFRLPYPQHQRTGS